MATVTSLLDELNLSHLYSPPGSPLESESLREGLLALPRLQQLSTLKSFGVSKLAERQSIANAISKAVREGKMVGVTLGSSAIVASSSGVLPPVSPPAPPPPEAAMPVHRSSAVAAATPASANDGIATVTLLPGYHCRLFVISDVHADHAANLQWLEEKLPARTPNAFDVILCPGDVSDREPVLRATLELLKGRFDEVVFTAGNHDIWVPHGGGLGGGPHSPSVTRVPLPYEPVPGALGSAPASSASSAASAPAAEPSDSLAKLRCVYALCEAMGVRVSPLLIECDDAAAAEDVLIVPLQSWYHASWDQEPDLASDEGEIDHHSAGWTDNFRCRWPSPLSMRGR